MSRSRLPAAVPPDNQTKSFGQSAPHGAGGEGPFEAPDTATPDFVIPNSNAGLSGAGLAASRSAAEAPAFTRPPDPAPAFARVVIETDDDEEDEDEDEEEERAPGEHQHVPYQILVVIGLLLVALAAFVATRSQDPALPDCASQPEWNQYNCRKS